MSQAEINIIFSVVGTNVVFKGRIQRFNAPMTVQRIMDGSPWTLRSRFNIGGTKSYLMLIINIKKGMEKTPATQINVGDILYCPQQDAIFLVFTPTKFSIPVKFLGNITDGLEKIAGIPSGANIKIDIKS